MKKLHQTTPYARHTDANREFQEPPSPETIGIYLLTLLAATAINFLFLLKWA
jgi:hypothetical protein